MILVHLSKVSQFENLLLQTSRVFNSTFRYVKFVRKLRAEEEDQRKGAENKLKELKDKQNSDFFIRCDRR